MASIKIEPVRDGGFVVYEVGDRSLAPEPVFAGSHSDVSAWISRWMMSTRPEDGGCDVNRREFWVQTPVKRDAGLRGARQMDFEEKLGDLVDEALGLGGVEIDDVIETLAHQLHAVRLLKAEVDKSSAVADFEDFARTEHYEG